MKNWLIGIVVLVTASYQQIQIEKLQHYEENLRAITQLERMLREIQILELHREIKGQPINGPLSEEEKKRFTDLSR